VVARAVVGDQQQGGGGGGADLKNGPPMMSDGDCAAAVVRPANALRVFVGERGGGGVGNSLLDQQQQMEGAPQESKAMDYYSQSCLVEAYGGSHKMMLLEEEEGDLDYEAGAFVAAAGAGETATLDLLEAVGRAVGSHRCSSDHHHFALYCYCCCCM
jgi:hypothetical protein